MERRDLEGLTREELIARADALGVPRPRVLTQPELIDEILTRSARTERERARSRGFLGRARDLLARVVERGLHLPDAARALRGSPPNAWPPPPPPLPTVTLAEIYAAQGHLDRAIGVLDEVLSREPDHEEARQLRDRLTEQAQRPRGKRGLDPAQPPGAKTGPPAQPDAATDEMRTEPELKGTANADPRPVSEGTANADPRPVLKRTANADPRPVSTTDPTAQAEAAAKDTAGATPPNASAVEDAADPDDVAAAAADEAALPERYDVDEIVGMAVEPETIYLYWEVRPTTLARAHARRPDGRLVVRLVAVLPSWDGPEIEQRDIPIDALFGDRFVRDVPAGSNVRMSTGWLAGDDFEPFAVGLEVASPRAFPSAHRARPAAPPPWAGAEHAPPWTGAEHAPPRAGWITRGAPLGGAAALGPGAGGGEGGPSVAGPAPGAPGRFPTGSIPTAAAIAHAIAVTRGGASELGRDHQGERRPHGGASELSRGGASELWRGARWGRSEA